MKANIHPKYEKITVSCSCGHVFETGSVLCKNFTVEVCNKCHPFYTGQQKIMDTAGRVERFKGRFGALSFRKGKGTEDSSLKSDKE